MKEDDNIFEAASKKLSKSDPTQDKQTPEPKPSAAARMPKINTEIQEMMDKMDQMKRDLDSQLDKFRRQMGMTEDQLKKYLNYTRNLNLDKWDSIKENASKLDNSLMEILGKNYTKWEDIDKSYHAEGPAPVKAVSEKERKSKTSGGRRKWMPMK